MEETRTDNPALPQPVTTNHTDRVSAFDNEALETFGAGSDNNNLPVENAFFQGTEDTAEAAPQTEQSVSTEETTTQDAKNDERRYQYWQSQAAKRENELKELQAQVQQAQQAPATQAPQEQAETVQEFPPPPSAPKKPARFSREEAWSDPSSESAKYLDEKESWDGDIGQYNELKHQYDLALMQEKLDSQAEYLQKQEAQRQGKIEQTRQLQSISEHVQGHYGLSPSETNEFINTMSNPESISMDNLVQLYRMGKTTAQPVVNQGGPSEAFKQAQNAQQIPSPMGVMPAQGNKPNVSTVDSIMDDLIKTEKAKNPWS